MKIQIRTSAHRTSCRSSASFACLSVAIAGLFASCAMGGAPIHGGPMWNAVTGSGYQSPYLPESAGSAAGNGVGVGCVTRYSGFFIAVSSAVRWDASGTVELGNLGTGSGGTSIYAYAVNTAGTAIGYATKFSGGTSLGSRAVRWDPSGTVATELGTLGTDSSGYTSNYAIAINSSGTAAGNARIYNGDTDLGARAVRWDASGTSATELGHLGTDAGGSTISRAYAISDAGDVVGYAKRYSGNVDLGYRAVRWDASGTSATELGTIGTNASGFANNFANAINSAGIAVGMARKYDVNTDLGYRAVRWDASGTFATELGNLGTNSSGVTTNIASAINSAGTAVGHATKYSGNVDLGYRAVRWDATGTSATELGNLGTNSSGQSSSIAYLINRFGSVVGIARKYSGNTDLGLLAVVLGQDGVAIDLNTLLQPSDSPHWTLTRASSISDANWVVGIGSFDPDGPSGPLAKYDRLFLLDVISVLGTPGDATRDGNVDFDDLLILAQHYSGTTGKWDTGDFTGDGNVDFSDLLLLAQHYGNSAPSDPSSLNSISTCGNSMFQADWVLARSLVPEPSWAGLLGLLLLRTGCERRVEAGRRT